MELKKKGFFFSIDAFMAILIFTVMIVSIYGYFINIHELRQQYFYSEDLLDIFINTHMNELDLSLTNYPSIFALYSDNNDEVLDNMDPSLTIMEQIVTLRNNNTAGASVAATTIVTNLTTDLLGSKYGFSFDLGRDEIYGTEKNITSSVARQRFV